jgi:aminopeptidase N
MRNSFLALAALLLVFSASNFAQQKSFTYPYDDSYFFEDREIQVYHYNASLIIRPYDTLVQGEAEFSFKTLRETIDSIVFHVPEMNISEVRIDGQRAITFPKGDHIMVVPPFELQWQQHYKILFIYDVKPTDGLYFTGWNDPQQLKREQIWAHRPNHWLPYFPAVLTVQMAVTVPDNLKVFTNGEREAVVTNKDNTQTWHYKMNHPHPFFSTCLVIGDMKWKSTETKAGLPVELWYFPDQEDHFEPTYRYQLEMFDFLEEEFGFAYP